MANDDWMILERVYRMLRDNHILQTSPDEPVVEFKYPQELKNIVDFSLDSDNEKTLDEIEDLCKQVIKYSVKTGHRYFCNQLFGGCDPYGLAGSWITDALNTSQYTFEVAPSFTLIEEAVIDKCLRLFGFQNGDGIFSPGGSMSNMYGMVLARYKLSPAVKKSGLFGSQRLVAFTSQDAHYSIKKAIHWMGIGIDNLVVVESDEKGRMCPTALRRAIVESKAVGNIPFFVNATAGTTVLGAFDDIIQLGDVCREANVWLHVDACLGGTAILSKKHKHLLAGIDRVDSVAWNPHKTMGAPLQCSMILVRAKGFLHKCNSANADYLFQQDKFYDVSYDTGDKSVQCGRKVDAFKLWLMFKARGNRALARKMENAMEVAQYLTNLIQNRDGFRSVLNEFQYTNVCFWYIPKSIRNQPENDDWRERLYKVAPIIKEKMVKSGKLMIGYSPLPQKNLGNFFRMVITCYPAATKPDMDSLLNEIEILGETL